MIYELKNKYIKVEINDSPLEICSIKMNDQEYVYQKADAWKKQWPICFPWTGKFINNEYFHKDKKYQMNNHGFFRLIKNWKILSKTNEKIIFSFEDNNEFIDIYPFHFALKVFFEIKNKTIISNVEITNNSNEEMFYGFGWHPAFLIDSKTAQVNFSKKQKIITVPDDTFMDDNLPTTVIDSLVVDEFNFAKSNAYFIFNDESIFSLVDKTRELAIDCENYKYVVFWKCDNEANYFCVEPWASHQDVKGNENQTLKTKPSVLSLQPMQSQNYSLKVSIKK
ncbi:hypothetical protein [Spiroplasma endosymbiont of Amphibalanus improvisus]|uniref:aldose epimerase family protein n=1 Tax=Spiroplasma endosymbiont of Amphibalanus improvisus TaxID=3066327 RepID=UPI00313E0318